MRILLVEDEPAVARMVDRGLTAHGHQVLSAESGEDGLLLVRTEPFDLALLDIMLPGEDGFQVLAGIRRLRPELPIIMLTARDDLRSKVSALDGGADDYVTKPFAFEELLARIRALTRRADQKQAASIQFDDLKIDLLSHRAWRAGQPVELSRREFALLEYFARNQGQLLSRQQILSAVWEYDFEGESNIVDVYVRYLRQKLDRPGEPSLFTTLRGSGYRFDPPPAA
jgi:DNA-binding response OmpR family regulator